MVSVIMPAFNAGKFIATAIESVLKQTYADWELIVVDDKSTDNTYDIILDYASRDKRIKAYQLNVNSGSAQRPRLTAENIAQGSFICLLDADDELETLYLEKLLKRQEETDADAVIGRLCSMTENGIKKDSFNPTDRVDLDSIITGKEAFMMTVGSWDINGLGIFKREVLDFASKKSNQLLDSINADELYTRIKFLYCNKVAFCNADYFYRNNLESITKKFSIKLFDSLDAVSKVRLLALEIFGVRSIEYTKAVSYQFKAILTSISLYCEKMLEIDYSNRSFVKQKIHNSWRQLTYADVLRSSLKEGLIYFLGFRLVYYLFVFRNYVRGK